MEKKFQVGDVIVCPQLATFVFDNHGNIDDTVLYNERPYSEIISHFDDKLCYSLLLITDISWDPGQEGTMFNNYDEWPGTYEYEAIFLSKNGEYRKKGRKIKFTVDSCYGNSLDFDKIEKIGKMKRVEFFE
jgi:hypothetical protein